MTVYVVTDPMQYKDGKPSAQFDIRPAAEYGNIVILIPQTEHPHVTEAVVRLLNERLADYTDDDYILPVGNPALIATTVAIASDINGGVYNLLMWDKIDRKYDPLRVNINVGNML